MEAEIYNTNHMPSVVHRFLPVVGPVLLISIGYVDPGKWAATVEGGTRFGFDLVTLMLVFNLAAVLCQYLSARIGLVTGRDLAQICSDEYGKFTCLLLGVQTELSMILLDVSMVLGIAHGLNLLFGWDLFTCVFLTAANAFLYPLFTTLLENCKAKFLCICIAGLILLSFVLGVLISQPEVPLSMNGMLTRLSGESAFALMSILGASIMPHNFYLHSSIVQQYHGPPNVSKDALCHNHFFAIFCIFSGIYLVNYVLMNSAANVFYSTGLVLLTFQDAMSLLEQVFRGPIAPVAFFLVLFLSNQITALTWSLGGQAVLHDFLKLDIPGWLHCATIRIIAIIPALYCVWNSGAEGMYQLLIFSQALVAVLLPSSVIPLFRISSSRPIMGVHKASQIVEFLSVITFIGMLVLKVVFVVEMILGNSDWVGNLKWNMGNSISISYVVLLITVCGSFCLMLWLAATPLKSASAQLDAQVWNWDSPKAPDSFAKEEDIDKTDTRSHEEAHVKRQELSPLLGKALDNRSDRTVTDFDLDLPETIMEPDYDLQLSVEENSSDVTTSSSSTCHREESISTAETIPVSTVDTIDSDLTLMDKSAVKIESVNPVERNVGIEDLPIEKDDDDADTWEPEESSKGVSGSTPSLTPEGPGSFRSLSGKSEEGGNGAGSLSRLAGLGRAARRQLAAVLDEFWGQLYDFHGQATREAKFKKLDVLLGIDSKASSSSSSLKVDTTTKEASGYFPSVGGRGPDPLSNSILYDSPKQQRMQSPLEPSYEVQRSSPIWSSHMQLLDAYVDNSRRGVPNSGERRYLSMRNLPSTEGWDNQPATVHGYQIASYLSRIAKDQSSDNLTAQFELPALKSPALGGTNYRDPLAFAIGQKLQNGLSTSQASSFQNLMASRNNMLPSERPYYALCPSGNAENVVSPANTKKYHSLPDIHRDMAVSHKSGQLESTSGFGSSVGRSSYEQSLYSSSGSRTGAPLAFDELSPSKVYTKALSSPMKSSFYTGSFWTRQPFEQFGVADNSRAAGNGGVGSRTCSVYQEASSPADLEAKLLQSFRYCIVKLLKLEGSDWLFRQNDGADEDLIDRVAAREKFLYEAETREMNRGIHMADTQYGPSDRKFSAMKNNDEDSHFLVSSVPHCGEGCVWKSDLVISFGVWCIHRILDLSLMESRPELWGKYTYVLNRLQGIIDLAFSKPRTPMTPCFCLQIPAAQQQRLSPPVSNGMLPPAAKPARGKCTNASTLLDIIKDVEMAISVRKGRTGTAAGDVAFPKGKENLASVLKRYKRRLSNKPVGGTPEGPGSRKVPTSAPYGS